jgi:hypothetical protein
MKLPEEVRISMPVFILAAIFALGLTGENVYLAGVNQGQQHTIRQYMGLEPGVDALPPFGTPEFNPEPPKALTAPVGPEKPKSFTDQRRWQREL